MTAPTATTPALAALALNGGPKAKQTAFGTGQRYRDHELDYLRQALEQNTLFYGYGKQVKAACEKMKAYTGMPYVVPCSSGSAACHLGLIAAGIGPGDEVIVTPHTDNGSIIGIIAEGAVPVFCDCEGHLQASARTIAARVTRHTKAVLLVHLAGFPAPVREIAEYCKGRGIGLAEDCAQSWGARLDGQLVGSFGDAGCYSTNDFKHISTGDGGFVALRDAELYRRVSNYSDKHYDRMFDGKLAGVYFGMNYRMGELQGAVALAQLEKVDAITARHHALGERLRGGLVGLKGGHMVEPVAGGYGTDWWNLLVTHPDELTVSRDEVVTALQAEGLRVGTYAKYDLIGKKLFKERVTRPWMDGVRRHYPFIQPDSRDYSYDYAPVPNHKRFLDTAIMVSMGSFWTDADIDETVAGVRKVFAAYAK